mmetsp:Transcript_5650/g.14061  ORF Transcript_5650/g.14061 Transcript_5650/m.14061 type:complete len:465 (+) Transcript_5650:318-1712(+)
MARSSTAHADGQHQPCLVRCCLRLIAPQDAHIHAQQSAAGCQRLCTGMHSQHRCMAAVGPAAARPCAQQPAARVPRTCTYPSSTGRVARARPRACAPSCPTCPAKPRSCCATRCWGWARRASSCRSTARRARPSRRSTRSRGRSTRCGTAARWWLTSRWSMRTCWAPLPARPRCARWGWSWAAWWWRAWPTRLGCRRSRPPTCRCASAAACSSCPSGTARPRGRRLTPSTSSCSRVWPLAQASTPPRACAWRCWRKARRGWRARASWTTAQGRGYWRWPPSSWVPPARWAPTLTRWQCGRPRATQSSTGRSARPPSACCSAGPARTTPTPWLRQGCPPGARSRWWPPTSCAGRWWSWRAGWRTTPRRAAACCCRASWRSRCPTSGPRTRATSTRSRCGRRAPGRLSRLCATTRRHAGSCRAGMAGACRWPFWQWFAGHDLMGPALQHQGLKLVVVRCEVAAALH